MIQLRDASSNDAHAIATLLVASWQVAYHGLIPDEILAGLSVPEREGFWRDALTTPQPRTRTVLALAGRTALGFAAIGPPLNSDDSSDPTLGDLYALYLNPAVWGRGIGSHLHAAALDRLRACDFTQAGLWILDGNQRAMRFYLRQGWTDTGRTQIDHGPNDIELHERRLHRALITPAEA